MATGTKARPFLRQLEASGRPFYVIGSNGNLIYLAAGCADWLRVDLESLVDRRCVAGASISDEPLDRLAAALSPPPGLTHRGTASLRVQPPPVGDLRPQPMEVRFTRVGEDDTALILAVGGAFEDREVDREIHEAVALRSQLDHWRRSNTDLANEVTAGQSSVSRRLRRRLRVAAATRTDIGFLGPKGCCSEAIARSVHQVGSPNEPIIANDGSLMDPELLDAVLAPLIHPLTESPQSLGTTLIRNVDEMPVEAQLRLVEIWKTFDGRLRLIGLCNRRPVLTSSSDEAARVDQAINIDEASPEGICQELWEILSALTVPIESLTDRVEDIPMLAAAILDRRHAAGEGPAERFTRGALDALVMYPWPGDMEELDAAVRHAIHSSRGETIGIDQLPLAIRSYRTGEGSITTKRLNLSLDDALARFELRMIHQTLDASDGNRAEAARRLGISRARLLRRLESQDD